MTQTGYFIVDRMELTFSLPILNYDSYLGSHPFNLQRSEQFSGKILEMAERSTLIFKKAQLIVLAQD